MIENIAIEKFQNIYTPGTILGVYASALHTSTDGRIVLAKGVYSISQNQKEYGGYYYDTLKSPNDNKSIKAKVPSLLRSKLENDQIYIFKGYIEKRINFSAIELVFVVDEILQKEKAQISDEEIKRFELIQNKISKGYRDFEAIVKEHIYTNTRLKIANLYGSTAIVHKDFEKGLADAVTRFEISNHRFNFISKRDLIAALRKLKTLDYDVIAFIRGGGDKASLEVFNDPDLGNEAIGINQILVTAVGHTVNESLMDKIADKKFALPHDYGNSLKVWVDQAVEEQTKSKSRFMDQVKQDLTKTFTAQISTLQKQLEVKNKEYETAQTKFKEMVEQNQKDKDETIRAKEKAFETSIKSLQEQIKSKEDSLKVIQDNNKAAYNNMYNEKEKLSKKLDNLSKTNQNIALYIAAATIIGFILGILIKIFF